MARIKQGFLGNASGKLGNVVFAKWRRLETARQYQPDIQDANSPDQQKQRNRMVALLEFLKPLNKTFIRNFNAPYVKTSTPWAKAIRDNMPMVSPSGCMSLQNLVLGNPDLPKVNITGAVYNPFIDQIQLKYTPPPIPGSGDEFPYIGISALGKYPTPDGSHSFDVRHLVMNLPDGSWYCYLTDEVESSWYLNWWEGGRLWLILDEEEIWKTSQNPFLNISEPVFFQAAPLIEGFNTAVSDNLVPVNALTWAYKQIDTRWELQFSIDYAKTQLSTPADYTLIFWGVGLINGSSVQAGPVEWDLQFGSYGLNLGEQGLPGAAIILYSIFDKNGVQVSRFNRIYLGKGSDGKDYPFYDQIFACNYSHPASFLLPGNQCGFCGSFEEIFSDFIDLWNQGVIHKNNDPSPVKEYGLTIEPPVNGTVQALNYRRTEGNTFFYVENQDAHLVPNPAPNHTLDKFTGPDAASVVPAEGGQFKIAMSKEMAVSAAFKAV